MIRPIEWKGGIAPPPAVGLEFLVRPYRVFLGLYFGPF